MASDIAKASQLAFDPNLLPFGAGRALFFCTSFAEVNRIIAKVTILTRGIIVSLNKWYELLNTVDPSRAKFDGWITVQGLPFNLWTEEAFDHIASMCGGLAEIHKRTQEFSILSEARI